jgi:hypothetical protein
MIHDGEKGWEHMLPEGSADLIKSKNLFGYNSNAKALLEKQE